MWPNKLKYDCLWNEQDQVKGLYSSARLQFWQSFWGWLQLMRHEENGKVAVKFLPFNGSGVNFMQKFFSFIHVQQSYNTSSLMKKISNLTQEAVLLLIKHLVVPFVMNRADEAVLWADFSRSRSPGYLFLPHNVIDFQSLRRLFSVYWSFSTFISCAPPCWPLYFEVPRSLGRSLPVQYPLVKTSRSWRIFSLFICDWPSSKSLL